MAPRRRRRLRSGRAARPWCGRRCGGCPELSALLSRSHPVPSVSAPGLPPPAPAAVQPLRRGLCSGLHAPQPITRSAPGCPKTCCRDVRRQSPHPSAAGEKDGGHDGETLPASQLEAPSLLLQESPKEDLGAMREEGSAEHPHPKRRKGLGPAQGQLPSGSDGGGVGAGQKEEARPSLRNGEIRYRRLEGSLS